MNRRTVSLVYVLVALSLVLVSALAGCAPAPAAPAAPAAPTAAPAEPAAAPVEPTAAPAAPTAAPAAKVVNRAGVELPADAAPIEKQVLNLAADDGKWIGWDSTVYDSITSSTFGLSDSCVRPDRNFDPQPNACESWEVSEDGLTWTFHLQKDKVWSDGTPVTADDWVFTLQRYARPDYDFEWFYGMAGIENWDDVVSGAKPPEELGAKKVDDYTFTVKTDAAHPVPGAHLLGPVGRPPAHRQGPPGRWLLGFRSQDCGLDRTLQAGKMGEGQGDRLGRQRQVHRSRSRPCRTRSWSP